VARGDVYSKQRPTPTHSVGSTQAIEAYQFLESITSDLHGQPGSRAAAVARVQETSIRPWSTERWAPVAGEE